MKSSTASVIINFIILGLITFGDYNKNAFALLYIALCIFGAAGLICMAIENKK